MLVLCPLVREKVECARRLNSGLPARHPKQTAPSSARLFAIVTAKKVLDCGSFISLVDLSPTRVKSVHIVRWTTVSDRPVAAARPIFSRI